MKNFILIKNNIVVDKQLINDDELPEYIMENVDTVVLDNSQKFSINEEYSLDKYINYNSSTDELKQMNINNIKEKANELIILKYPLYKQLNNIRTKENLEEMSIYIDNIRKISNLAEINNIKCEDIDWTISH